MHKVQSWSGTKIPHAVQCDPQKENCSCCLFLTPCFFKLAWLIFCSCSGLCSCFLSLFHSTSSGVKAGAWARIGGSLLPCLDTPPVLKGLLFCQQCLRRLCWVMAFPGIGTCSSTTTKYHSPAHGRQQNFIRRQGFVLRRWSEGLNAQQVSRELGLSRKKDSFVFKNSLIWGGHLTTCPTNQ